MTMAKAKRDSRNRRRQLEQQFLNDIIQSVRTETAHGLDMQAYAQERLDYGVDVQSARTEPQLQGPDMEGFGLTCHGDADKRSELSETDTVSVPLSASLFGDYSYIYDEYIDDYSFIYDEYMD